MTSTPAPAPKISLSKKGADQPAQQAAPPAAAKVDGLALIMGRNAFYQHNYKTILYIVLGQIAVILTLLIMLLKLLDFTAARDYYFPMRENNEVIQELPLSEPLLTGAQIRDWADEAVTHPLTFGYYAHPLRLQNSRAYFTTPGWADFTNALDEAKVLSTIGAFGVEDASEQPKVVVTTLRPGTRAEIVKQGINGYRYEWHVKMTIDLSFYDTRQQYRQSWKVDLRIMRVRAMASRFGIGIHQLLAESSLE